MKKIFIVTGEVSGDKSAAWFLQKYKRELGEINCYAVGGSALKNAGAILYDRMEKLNVTGIVEIIGKLRLILNFLKKLCNYILENNFDQVVLVDFPGFNLKLAKKLKSANSNIEIIYFSPPQVWIWGKWRVKKLKKYCDKLIVLYPFEVLWYKNQGIKAEFWGNPVYSKLQDLSKDKYFEIRNFDEKENQIAIIPASRKPELDKLFPLFANIVKKFKLAYPKIKIILPLAESFRSYVIEEKLKKYGLWRWGKDIEIVQGEKDKLKALSKCILAITKPGTTTLELAILNIPAIVVYKTSWSTYLIAKYLVQVKYMALPNLLLNKVVYHEFIQRKCDAEKIFNFASQLYKDVAGGRGTYSTMKKDFIQLKEQFVNYY
ncbi:lipid-A-disaccharide synthase [Candidatus Dependentiae bacterium]|nr:lipid-A-disaccharide synthase [Candidatus Dependentiae bacterium]